MSRDELSTGIARHSTTDWQGSLSVQLGLQRVDLVDQVERHLDPDRVQTDIRAQSSNLPQAGQPVLVEHQFTPFDRSRWHKADHHVAPHLPHREPDRLRCDRQLISLWFHHFRLHRSDRPLGLQGLVIPKFGDQFTLPRCQLGGQLDMHLSQQISTLDRLAQMFHPLPAQSHDPAIRCPLRNP